MDTTSKLPSGHGSSTKPSAEVTGHLVAFNHLAMQAPAGALAAAVRTLEIAVRDGAKAAFVTRSLNAVGYLAEASTRNTLLEAASAEADTMVLLNALDNPATLLKWGATAPGVEARIRGLREQHRLLSAEGGVCSARELGELLQLTRQAIDKRRKSGKLIALDLGRHGFRYPVWQIQDGAVLPGLDRVIAELSECDPWTQVAFMLSPNSWLGDETPLAVLRRGEADRVVATAELFDY
jgi:hypothetical protein